MKFDMSKTRRGRVQKGMAQTIICDDMAGVVVYDDYNDGQKIIEVPAAYDEQNDYIRSDGCVGTLTTDGSTPKHNNRIIENNLRIRKLTPLECFRLMAFDDSDFKVLAENGISNSQIYKMAGNSIVVSVLEYLFAAIFNQYGDIFETGKSAEEFGELVKYDPQQMTFDDLFKLGEY